MWLWRWTKWIALVLLIPLLLGMAGTYLPDLIAGKPIVVTSGLYNFITSNWPWLLLAGFALSLVSGWSWKKDRDQGRRTRLMRHFRLCKLVRHLGPVELGVKEYRHGPYVAREADDRVKVLLAEGSKRVFIVGKSLIGKSRLAYEALQGYPNWYVAVPLQQTLLVGDVDLSYLKGKKVVLLLENLHRYVDKITEPIALIRNLEEVVRGGRTGLRVLGTCLDGKEERDVREKLSDLYLSPDAKHITPELITAGEGRDLAAQLDQTWSPEKFDGTPGSVLVGANLEVMKDRYETRLGGEEAQIVLKACRLLYTGGVTEYRWDRVTAVAQRVWGQDLARRGLRDRTLYSLWSNGFTAQQSLPLQIPEAYVEGCISDYPNPWYDIEELARVLEEQKDGEGAFSLGITAHLRGRADWPLAERMYRYSLDMVNFPTAHNNYANLLANQGRSQEAEKHYQAALGINPEYANAHYNYAILLADQGRPQEAEEHYLAALRINPQHANAHNNYALLLPGQGRPQEAEEHYLAALGINPEYANAHNNYAILLADQGRSQEEEEHYQAALGINPEYANAHYNYAILLADQGRSQEAEEHYQAALGINPEYANAHNNYAILLADQGRSQEAEEHYQAALGINPEDSDTHYNYANLLAAQGRSQEAEEHYQAALDINPEYANAHYNYANLLRGLGRSQETEEHYQEALGINPEYASAHYNYALLLADQGRSQEAEEHYQAVLGINPEFANAHNNYANLLADQGRSQEAEEHYQAALDINPEDSDAHNNYAILLAAQGRSQEAEEHYQAARKIGTP